jgi:hypothetical protein
LLAINIYKLNPENIRVIIPQINQDPTKIYTAIGTGEVHTERQSTGYKEITDLNTTNLDIYPACTPDLLFAWFGCKNSDQACKSFSEQNTAFAAITAQEVIMSGNYPIDIIDVIGYYRKGAKQMVTLETPVNIKDYIRQRTDLRSGKANVQPVVQPVVQQETTIGSTQPAAARPRQGQGILAKMLANQKKFNEKRYPKPVDQPVVHQETTLGSTQQAPTKARTTFDQAFKTQKTAPTKADRTKNTTRTRPGNSLGFNRIPDDDKEMVTSRYSYEYLEPDTPHRYLYKDQDTDNMDL